MLKTIRKLADDSTTLSSTRWAFATVIIFDIIVISLSLVIFIISHFIGFPIALAFFDKEAILLGVLTTLVATTKGLQGFERHDCTKPRVPHPKKPQKQIE